MKRDVQIGTLTQDERRAAQETAKELTSPEYLSLHKTEPIVDPRRTLKISDVIQAALLNSTPDKDWRELETVLKGNNLKDWKTFLV